MASRTLQNHFTSCVSDYLDTSGNVAFTRISLMKKTRSKYYEFRRILSTRMSELTAAGVGIRPKQAEPISAETENKLLEKGLLGNGTGKSLLNTMFFYNCNLFGLRGVDEHRGMEIDQIELGVDQHGHFVKFKGRSSKTYKGGLAQRHVEAKEIVHHFQNLKLYNMYKDYIEICRNCGEIPAFYRRPLENGPDNELRFIQQPIGLNKLSSIMKTMFSEAGIPGYYTNHSGKRTLATTLYQAGVPEQEIMERTGHRSVESVRKYKRPSSEMLKDISNLLEPQLENKEEPPEKLVKIEKNQQCNPLTSSASHFFQDCNVYFINQNSSS